MLLYIIRHGEPDYTTDTLLERGKLQAEAVARRLFDSKIDRVFSSPMGRAKETAEPTCRLLGLEYTVEEWAHEIGDEKMTPYPDGIMKSISALPSTDFRENGNINLSYEDTYKCTGIDQTDMRSAVEYVEREGNAFLERLCYKEENGVYRILRNNEEKVALFCHTAFERTWLSSLLHIPLHIVWASFQITHTGVTVIEFKNYESGFTSPRCLCLSDMSHLYKYGPDMIFENRWEL